jgi:hypothetical protein
MSQVHMYSPVFIGLTTRVVSNSYLLRCHSRHPRAIVSKQATDMVLYAFIISYLQYPGGCEWQWQYLRPQCTIRLGSLFQVRDNQNIRSIVGAIVRFSSRWHTRRTGHASIFSRSSSSLNRTMTSNPRCSCILDGLFAKPNEKKPDMYRYMN